MVKQPIERLLFEKAVFQLANGLIVGEVSTDRLEALASHVGELLILGFKVIVGHIQLLLLGDPLEDEPCFGGKLRPHAQVGELGFAERHAAWVAPLVGFLESELVHQHFKILVDHATGDFKLVGIDDGLEQVGSSLVAYHVLFALGNITLDGVFHVLETIISELFRNFCGKLWYFVGLNRLNGNGHLGRFASDRFCTAVIAKGEGFGLGIAFFIPSSMASTPG